MGSSVSYRRADDSACGIQACFDSLDSALLDAEENIRRTTKSDFMVAHFYEVVKSEVLTMMTPNAEVTGAPLTSTLGRR